VYTLYIKGAHASLLPLRGSPIPFFFWDSFYSSLKREILKLNNCKDNKIQRLLRLQMERERVEICCCHNITVFPDFISYSVFWGMTVVGKLRRKIKENPVVVFFKHLTEFSHKS